MTRNERIADWLDRQALFLAALTACWAAFLLRVEYRFNQDGWLSLVAGREVAQHGIPHHDRLAVLTSGAKWVDQQWLAQWLFYELHAVGGLALVCITYVGLSILTIALAIAAARRLGASDVHILWVLPLPALLFLAASGQVRTQGLAYPLFILVLWLLAVDDREPGRRVYLVLPILVLWSNLHGSVTLGVAMAAVYGFTLLARQVFRDGARPRWPTAPARGLIFLILPALCLFVTPYGLEAVGYYRDTVFNSSFRGLISEWAPVTSVTLLAVPFFIVAFTGIWLLGRSRGTSLFVQLTFLVMVAAGISAVRNVTWLGLAALVLLPSVVGTVSSPPEPAPRRPRVNLALAGMGMLVLLTTLVGIGTRPETWFERGYDDRARAVVVASLRADPTLQVYAGDRFSDWLLWREPGLTAGRIAYDSRLELLGTKTLQRLVDLSTRTGPAYDAVLRDFPLLVLDPDGDSKLTKALLKRPGTRILLRRKHVVVALRDNPGVAAGETARSDG